VYKKYVRRNGKLYGPYYYTSMRDNHGGVKSVYLGNGNKNRTENRILRTGIVALLLMAAVLYLFIFSEGVTGFIINASIANISFLNGSLMNNPYYSDISSIPGDAETADTIDTILSQNTGNYNASKLSSRLAEATTLTVSGSVREFEVDYYTEAPSKAEKDSSLGKEVVVSAPDGLNYTDVHSFTDIPEKYPVGEEGRIKIFWKEEGKYIPFDAYDLDGDGKLDYVEWTVPHLSNQTFLIILVSRAEHLDGSRSFMEDIYGQVRELDGNYKNIPAGHYVRVTFEKKLNSRNDITFYGKSEGSGVVEVYEKNGTQKIADFVNISEDKKYRASLANLQGGQDSFDLLVKNSAVDFDYIVDPSESSVDVSFVSPTPGNASTQAKRNIYVSVSSADAVGGHYAFVDFNRSLLLWMRMDDVSGGNPLDLSSYGNNGVAAGSSCYGSATSDCTAYTTTALCEAYDYHGSQCIYDFTCSGGDDCGMLNSAQCTEAVSKGQCSDDGDGTCSGYFACSTWNHDPLCTSLMPCNDVFYSCTNTSDLTCDYQGSSSAACGAVSGCSWEPVVTQGSGKFGQAFAFDGINDVITFNGDSTPIMTSTANLTISAWINPAVVPQNGMAVYNKYGFGVGGGGNGESSNIWFFSGQDYDPFTDSGFTAEASTWYHVVLVRNDTTESLYINGQFYASSDKTPSTPDYTRIGGGLIYSFSGSVDDVLFFNRELSIQEILALYSAGVNQYGNNFTGLENGTYPFTAYAVDTSANKNQTEQRFVTVNTSYVPPGQLTACLNLTIANMAYTLMNNVTGNGSCFNILANNVTLDGQGFTVNYSSNGALGYGVNITSVNYTVVRNLTIIEGTDTAGNNYGLYLKNSNLSVISNISISTSGPSAVGVYLSYSSYNTFRYASVNATNSTDIYLLAMDNSHCNNSMDDTNTASGKPVNYTLGASGYNINALDYSQNGQYIFAYASNIAIRNNNFLKNTLIFCYANNSVIENNTLSTVDNAIYLFNTSLSNLSNNKICTSGPSAVGAYIRSSSSNTFSNTSITTSGSSAVGAYLSTNSDNNNLSSISITTSGPDAYGVYLVTSSSNTFSNTSILTSNSSAYGASLSSSSSNTFSNTSITTSGSDAYGTYLFKIGRAHV